MTDLAEARKALEFLELQINKKPHRSDTGNIAYAAMRLDIHLPAILQCLQAAEQAQAVREQGELPKISAW